MLCGGVDVENQAGPKREGEEHLSYASALQAIAMRPALIGQVKVGRGGRRSRHAKIQGLCPVVGFSWATSAGNKLYQSFLWVR